MAGIFRPLASAGQAFDLAASSASFASFASFASCFFVHRRSPLRRIPSLPNMAAMKKRAQFGVQTSDPAAFRAHRFILGTAARKWPGAGDQSSSNRYNPELESLYLTENKDSMLALIATKTLFCRSRFLHSREGRLK
jgi:hypothetical protein